MTVKELIRKLKDLNQDAEVAIWVQSYDTTVAEIDDVTYGFQYDRETDEPIGEDRTLVVIHEKIEV